MRLRIRQLYFDYKADILEDISRGEYAKRVGVGRSTVNRALDDPYANMRRETLERFAEFHQVTIGELFEADNPKKVTRPLTWSDAVGVVPS